MNEKEELEALTQFLYMAPTGLAQAGIDGSLVIVNPICAQLLMPLSRDGNLINLYDALEHVAPDLRTRVSQFQSPHGMICEDVQIPYDAGAPNRANPKVLSLTLMKLDESRLMAVMNDITRSVKRERELRQSEAWFNAIFAGVTDYALMRLNQRGQIESWNPTIGRLLGFEANQVDGLRYSVFYPDGAITAEHVLDRLHEADKYGWSLDEGWQVRADGTRFWGSCLIAPLDAAEENQLSASGAAPSERTHPGYSLIVRDITDKRSANEALRRAIGCDHLTGLSNRRAFYQAAEREMERCVRMPRATSAIAIDADHFKSINDRFGHAAGDKVLCALADTMVSLFREVDVIARFGGEEFMVLTPGTALSDAEQLAKRLCEQVAATSVEFDDQSIHFTVSAGVATLQPGMAGIEELIKQADTALYAAKRAGRNTAVRFDKIEHQANLHEAATD